MTAKEIAAGLTEAQRRAVMLASGAFRVPPRGHAYWMGTMIYGHRLAEYRIGSLPRLYRLTPLGLAVKAILEKENRDAARM